ANSANSVRTILSAHIRLIGFLLRSPSGHARKIDLARAAPSAKATLLNDDRQHGFDVADDFVFAQARSRLHDAECDLLERPRGTVRMNGRDGAGMSGVYGAQKRVSFRTANLAKKYSVGAQAHRGLQKALDGHASLALIAFGSDERQEVFLQR